MRTYINIKNQWLYSTDNYLSNFYELAFEYMYEYSAEAISKRMLLKGYENSLKTSTQIKFIKNKKYIEMKKC